MKVSVALVRYHGFRRGLGHVLLHLLSDLHRLVDSLLLVLDALSEGTYGRQLKVGGQMPEECR